jgi:hypothetical protein
MPYNHLSLIAVKVDKEQNGKALPIVNLFVLLGATVMSITLDI